MIKATQQIFSLGAIRQGEAIMGLFSLFGGGSNINDLVEEARQTENAVIIDVRTPAEYKQGHIKGAYNIPLDQIDAVKKTVKTPAPRSTFIAPVELEAEMQPAISKTQVMKM